MKKKLLTITTIIVLIGACLFTYVDSKINNTKDSGVTIKNFEQHKTAMENGANPNLGVSIIPDNYIVNEQFESHLPLVVMDIGDNEIEVNKKFDLDENGDQIILKNDDDGFVYGKISIIDNEDYHNTLSDKPAVISDMKIRLRGSSSQYFEKKQYAIKMLDSMGNSKAVDVMGMGENNDWILNISQLDESLMRNYVAYLFGSALFEGTPEARYCELVRKVDTDEYEYLGVYLMLEKIEKGKDKVDISTYEPGSQLVSYLLCRDRADPNSVQLSTYGNEEGVTYGRLSVLYPEKDKLNNDTFETIQEDIDTIERILYSDDIRVFNTWQEYLDKQSFVDYYLFNSIFRNYDAGNNSTYMYRDAGGKLKMGPVWDYDNACNNDYNAIQIPDYDFFYEKPWFDRLVLSKNYVSALESRYRELNEGIFSAQFISQYIDGVEEFLGNAAQRDWSRWGDHYGENSVFTSSYGLVDSQGFIVDRRTYGYTDAVLRFKSYFFLEEQYLEDNLRELEKNIVKDDTYIGSYFAILFGIVLICSVILIGRRKMFR